MPAKSHDSSRTTAEWVIDLKDNWVQVMNGKYDDTIHHARFPMLFCISNSLAFSFLLTDARKLDAQFRECGKALVAKTDKLMTSFVIFVCQQKTLGLE